MLKTPKVKNQSPIIVPVLERIVPVLERIWTNCICSIFPIYVQQGSKFFVPSKI